MSNSDRDVYKARAISAGARAQREADPELRGILESMATSYRTLARDAEDDPQVRWSAS